MPYIWQSPPWKGSNLSFNIRYLGLCDYTSTHQSMIEKITSPLPKTDLQDEIWLLEHSPVYTLGKHANPKHLRNLHAANMCNPIPIIQSDRGGEVTYHGPGQLILYFLYRLRFHKKGIKQFVNEIETALLKCFHIFGLKARLLEGRPGIYVEDKTNNKNQDQNQATKIKKIASIGLRVKNGITYHGISINYHMDLEPFSHINPCGYEGLEMTQVSHFLNVQTTPTNLFSQQLLIHLLEAFKCPE